MKEEKYKVSKALLNVLDERKRHVEKLGWTAEHDDLYTSNELILAAVCYALPELKQEKWPWLNDYWKPKDRRKNLVRAAALIVSEIERMDRNA